MLLKKYNLKKLLYYEIFDNIEEAIKREKQIKSGSRKKKEDLLEIEGIGDKGIQEIKKILSVYGITLK